MKATLFLSLFLKGLITFAIFVFSFSIKAQVGNCPFSAIAGPDQTICPSPGGVLIGTSPTPGVNYQWSPVTGLSNPFISNPIASPTTTTTYTLTATGQNLVLNGDFESGNSGFGTDYTYIPSSTYQGGVGTYTIGPNPNNYVGPWCNIPNHTPGGNNMLIIDGIQNYQPNNNFWSQNVSLQSNTDYLFSVWFYSIGFLNYDPYWPIIEVSVNGATVVSNYILPYNSCTGWVNLQIPINVGSLSNAFIEMRSVTFSGYSGGNDIAVDDITIACMSRDDVTVCVCTPAPPPYITTVQIPVRHVINFNKQDPATGRTCQNESWLHTHHPYVNACDGPFMMSGYMQYDNFQPAYNAFGLDFYMVPYNYSYTSSYLDFVGHDLGLYEPCFQNDIITAKIKFFHKDPPYCFKFLGWLNEYKFITQPHSGNNPFLIKRFTQNIIDACYSGWIYPINYPQYMYDNLPAIASDVVSVAASPDPYQDYSINITSMLKNGVVPQSNYIGFLVTQLQNSTYNNVLFKGITNFNYTVEAGEPYIELTYWRRPLPSTCIMTRPSLAVNDFFNVQSLYDTNMYVKKYQVPEDLSKASKLFPNPATTNITISSDYAIIYVGITSLTNQKLKEIKAPNKKTVTMNVSDLSAGVYTCTIVTEKGIENQKLIIKR